MAMNPRKVGEGLYQPVAEINVTPLVDVMLVLLIIFMVTAPMLATGIKVNLPSAKTAQPLETKQPVIVVVAKDGALSVGKDAVSRDELAAKVKAGLGDSNGVVQLRGDRDASYGDVVSVMDELAANGISRIAIVSGPRRAVSPAQPRRTRPPSPRQTRRRRDRHNSGRSGLRAAAAPSAMAPPSRRLDRGRAPRWRAPVRLSGAEAARADGRNHRRHSAGSSASGKPGAAGRRAEAARTIRASARSRRRAGSDRAAASKPGYPSSRRAASAACGGATSASHARDSPAAGRRAASAAAG